jgi:hypothetical protein
MSVNKKIHVDEAWSNPIIKEAGKIISEAMRSNKAFNANTPPMIMSEENEGVTIEVGVVINGFEFKGYFESESQSWWVDLGGITIGHRETSSDDIEKWYYLDNKSL